VKRLLFLALFLLYLVLPQHAYADAGWVIEKFESNIVIQQSGEVLVTEKIDVDFKDLDKHGIFRDIPYIYEANGDKSYTEIRIESVLQNGEEAEFTVFEDNGYKRIRIGDPDRMISGRNSYEMTYAAVGVLRGFEEYDELYWNVTGNNWEVAIENAYATVTLPSNGLLKFDCFEGYEGATSECRIVSETPKSVFFEASKSLDAYQGLTIVAGYNKGLVPLITVERPLTFWERFTQFPSLATLFSILFFGVGTIVYLWLRYGRDYWYGNIMADQGKGSFVKPIGAHETVVVEYTSPDSLRPAEIGVLVDERAHTHDVVATIIDLAARGFLTIKELPKKWMFGKMDYVLDKKAKDTKELLTYEKLLLDKLFDEGHTVNVSSLKNSFYTDLKKVKDALYEEVVSKNLFPTSPEKVRQKYLVIAILMIFFSFFLVGLAAASEIVLLANICIGFFACGIVLLMFSFFMPRRTATGRDLYRRTRGYFLFIDKAEKHRQKFFEKKNLFNEVLPYAIVFGLTGKFAKAMKEIGLENVQPTWYHGAQGFNMVNFESSMGSFSKSMSSAIASAPSSSGGFSGGGSSGGGFGGGGGGSW
jgi:uncharacterized membrane protein